MQKVTTITFYTNKVPNKKLSVAIFSHFLIDANKKIINTFGDYQNPHTLYKLSREIVVE